MMRALSILGCLLLAACAGTTTVPTTQPLPDQVAEEPTWTRTGHHDEVPPGSIEALGVGTTLEEARALAQASLATEIFGEAAAGFLLPTAHREGVDPSFEARLIDGRVAVLVAVPPERVEALLLELETPAPEAEVRTPIADTLHALDTLRRMHLACERRRVLFSASCELPNLAPAEAALAAYASSLALTPLTAEGVPLDGAGRPRTALAVRVTVHGGDGTPMPLAHAVVRVLGDAVSVFGAEATTDATGIARFAPVPDATLSGPITLEVDQAALFGAAAAEAPNARLTVPVRPASPTRVAIYIEERASGRVEATSRVNAGIRRVLGTDAQAVARALEASVGAPALATPPNAESLRAIASRFGGRVDVLLIGRVESEFANRMGAHKVWFEATFEGSVYDLWTGQRVADLFVDATASDFGDTRADHAARAALAEQLVERLRAVDLSGASAPVSSAR